MVNQSELETKLATTSSLGISSTEATDLKLFESIWWGLLDARILGRVENDVNDEMIAERIPLNTKMYD